MPVQGQVTGPGTMVEIEGRKASASGILARLKEPGNAAKMTTMRQGLTQRGLRQKSDFAMRGVNGLVLLEKDTRGKNDAAMTNVDIVQKIKELNATGLYEYVEPDWIVTVQQVPTDTAFTNGSLWGLRNTGQNGGTPGVDVNAAPAWALTTGSPTVVVGVVDTGIRYTHQDLAGNMWTNPGEVPANGIDDDSNGYVDDVHGINGITGSGNPMDDNNHGTHCAGTIAATGNDAGQHVGVAYNVKLMGLKFLSASGSGQTSDAIRCIDYGVAKGAHILSNSWGGGGSSQALRDSIAAANAAGVLFVAAAGNASSNNDFVPNYPSNYDPANVVAVAAVDRFGELASFSSYGAATVDLGAPGVDILSSTASSDTSYASFNGTSMATPHVAGVAALIKSRFPSATAAEIKNRLLVSTRPLASLAGRTVTGGIADAHAALTMAADGVLELRVAAAANPLRAGANMAFYVTVTDLVPVTGATVSGRLGTGSTTAFLDNGVSPDLTANDGIYSANHLVPATGSSVSLEVQAVAGGAPAAGSFNFPIIAPPANDHFASRILLQAGTSQTTGSNSLSTFEAGEPIYPAVAGRKSVWWEWVSGTTGLVTITTAGSNYDTTLAIYSGTASPALGTLVNVGSNDDHGGLSSTVTFNVSNGTRYYVQVNGYAGYEGSIMLNYPSPAAVNTPPVIVSQPNGAILVAGEPLALSVTATGTAPLSYQWFLEGAPISGATASSYSVTSVTDAHEGDYEVVITNPYGTITSASVYVGVDPISVRPPNDMFSAAEILPGASGRVNGTNQRASGEPGEPNHAGASTPLESVWFLWTAPSDGTLSVDTYGSSLDTTLAIYTGGTVGSLTQIAANNDSGGVQSFVTAAVTAGQVLSIAVDGAGTLESIFALNYHFQPKVVGLANDAFANRTVVAGAPGVITGSNIGATGEADEPAHTAFSSPAASVWWSWTAPVDGVAVVDTLSSNFDTELAVYTGSSVGALTLVAANDDAGGPQSRVVFPCTAGTSYAIAVDGRATAEGDIQLNIAAGASEPEIVLEQPVGTPLVDGLSTVLLGQVATGEVVTRLFTVRNTGGARLNGVSVIIDGVNPADFTLATAPASFVNAGGSTTFMLQFSPGGLGGRTAMLRVTSNDADEHTFDIALNGSGVLPAPEIVVEQPAGTSLVDGAATISFGSVVVGQGGDRVFTVRNTGNAVLSGLAVSFAGVNAADFSVTTPPATNVAPAAATTFIVRFAPGVLGARNASLLIASNDADEAPFDIALSGAGIVSPPVVRTLDATDRGWYSSTGYHDPSNDNYLTGYSLDDAPNQHVRSFFVFALPALAPEETVVSAELRLLNPSMGYASSDPSESLEIHQVTTPPATLTDGTAGVPGFTDLADGPLLGGPVSVPASSSSSIVSVPLNSTFVQAANAAAGGSIAVGGMLPGITLVRDERLFGHSDGAMSQTQLVLTTVTSYSDAEIAVEQPAGTGLADGASTVSFGGTAPGSTVDRTFTIRNPGILPLTGLGITLDGANAGDFSVTASPAPPLAPAGITTFTVRFAPSAGGIRTAVLHIASNDPNENPFDIALSGAGVVPAPEIAVEQPAGTGLVDGAAAVSFGYRPIGANNSLVFTVRNSGTVPLAMQGITIDGAHAADFTVTASPSTSVPLAGTTTFTVQFAPAAGGARAAVLHLASDDGDENPFDIALHGTGYAAPAGMDFQILTLEATGHAVVDHNSLTGDDRGGIAVSTDRVFVTGDSATSRHALADLSGGASLGRVSDGLCGDIGTGMAFVLAHNGVEIGGGGMVSQLIELNPLTGALTGNIIPLSTSIVMSGSYNGVFSGNGRIVLYNGTRMFDILVPSGVVNDLGPMTRPNWQGSETWASWGVAEFFGGELYVAYRSSAGSSIVRTRVPDGMTQTIATFSSLSDMSSWTVSPVTGRWYFHHEYGGQFGGSSETLGYANATFALGPPTQPPVIVSPLTAAAFVGLPFTHSIRATRSPAAYNATGLPAGLSVNTATGVISGVPAATGTYAVAVSATNVIGTTTETLMITVGTALASVSLFADASYVDTTSLQQLQTSLNGIGCAVTIFTGVTPAAWNAAFAASDVVVVPNMTAYLNLAALAAPINSQLYAGKALVVAGSSHVDESFFYDLRAWNIQEAGSHLTGGIHLTKAAGVPGFVNSPTSLASRTSTHLQQASTLPEMAQGVYQSGSYSGVFVAGRVGSVGYDWSSGPDPAWDAVLKDTLIAVTGYANAPEMGVELQGVPVADGSGAPASLGSVAIGSFSTAVFAIRNHGFADLTGLNVTVDGANAGDFIIGTSPTTPVAALGATTLTVRFVPLTAGTKTAALHISSNDADESPFDISLTGTGYVATPEIAVEQPAGTGLTDGVSTSSFGSVAAGLSSSLTFTIRNPGTGPLTGLAVTLDGASAGDFSVTTAPAASVLPAGSTTFTVRFSPTVLGPRGAALHVSSNDADENPFDIHLTGTGTVPVPEIALEQPAGTGLADGVAIVSFASQVVGGAGTSRTFTLRNTGTSSLAGVAVTLGGAHPADYIVTTPPAATVAPGASTTFTVLFVPLAPGPRSAALQIASNDADENPFDVVLTGAGVPAAGAVALFANGSFVDTSAGGEVQNTLAALQGAGYVVTTFTGITEADWNTAFAAPVVVIPDQEISPLSAALSTAARSAINSHLAAGKGLVVMGDYTSNETLFLNALRGWSLLNGPDLVGSTISKAAGVPGFPNSPATLNAANGTYAITTASLPAGSQLVYQSATNAAVFVNGTVAYLGYDWYSGPDAGWSLVLVDAIHEISAPVTGAEIVMEQPAGSALVDGAATTAFGYAPVGGEALRVFTVKNIGPDPLTGLGITIDGANAADFTVTASPASPVASAGSATFTVRFSPTATGNRTAALHLASNDANESPFDIELRGTTHQLLFEDDFDPSIDAPLWSGFGGTVAANAHGQAAGAGSSGNSLHFDGTGSRFATTVPLDTSSGGDVLFKIALGNGATSTWEMADSGEEVVLEYSNDGTTFFQIGTPYTSRTWQTVEVGIPAAARTVATRFRWRQLANSGTSYDHWGIEDVQISGSLIMQPEIAVEQPAGTSLTDGASTVTFGSVLPGSNTSLGFTIRNLGQEALTGVGVTLEGANASDYTVTSSPATSVAPGGSTTFAVRFAPGCPGISNAVLHISSNDANESPFDISLTGRTTLLAVQDDFDPGIDASMWSAFGGIATANTSAQAAGAGSTDNSLHFDGTGSRFATTVPMNTVGGGGILFKVALGNGPAGSSWETADTGEEVVLEYSNDGTTFTQIGAPYTSRTWQQVAVAIPAQAQTSSTSFRWRQLSNSGAGYDHWAIEDVVISETVTLTPEIVVEQPVGTGLTAGASTVDFGSVAGGSSASLTFTVRNSGTAGLTGLNVTIVDAHAADYSVTAAPTAPVAPSGSTTFTVRFAPSAGGLRTATLRISSNDADENPFDIDLSGSGLLTPEIVVEQPAGTGLTDGSALVSFGHTLLGATSTRTFTVRNTGTQNLTGLGIVINGAHAADFTVMSSPVAPLAPGGLTTFLVRFAPSAAGERTAVLHIASNDADENPFDITLTGTTRAEAIYGNRVPLPASSNHAPHYLVGSRVTVTSGGPLQMFGVDVRATGPNASFGLYTDAGGDPGTLVAQTGSFNFNTTGQIERPPLAPVVLTPGNYWLMAVYDGTASVGRDTSTSNTIKYRALTFTGTLPTAFGASSSYAGENMNYYIRVAVTPPSVTSVSPASGATTGGTSVIITGAGLTAASAVSFGGTAAASFVVVNDTTILATTSAHVAGVVDVAVTTPVGSTTGANLFNYLLLQPEIGVEQPVGTSLVDGASTAVFGTVTTGLGANLSFTVSNSGGADLTGLGITIDGINAAEFSVAGAPVAPVAAGGATTFVIRFAPTAGGARNAVLHLTSNDTNESPFDIALTGTGILAVPEIAVEQPAGTGLIDGASTAVFPTSVNGGQSTLVFTVRNAGNGILSGLGVSIDGANASEFAVTAAPATALGASNTTTFTVRFAPVAVGTSTAALHISSNDADENPFDVQLVGASAVSTTQTITASDRGWYRSNGTHTPTNTNYLTGTGTTPPYLESRSFFIFTIPALSPGEMITGAELRLQNPAGGFNSADASEMLQIRPVTTSVTTLAAGTGGTAAFADLADGMGYGGPHMVTAADNGSYVVIPLNADFLAAAQAQAGTAFALGCSVSSLRTTPLTTGENIFNGTSDGFSTTLVLTRATVVPEIAVEQPLGTNLTDGTAAVSFGACAGPVTRTFTVRNIGTASLTGLGVSISGANAADFSVTSNAAAPLAASSDTTFTVRFAPSAMGSRVAVLHIASNDVDESPFDISLSGSGVSAVGEFDSWVPVALPDRAAAATPHHDGVSNLMKYAFNMDADRPDNRVMARGTGTAGLPVITPAQAGTTPVFRFEFLRRIGSGLVYTPQRSSTLAPGSWTPLTSTPTIVPISAQWERVIYEEPVNLQLEPVSFGRVEITLPAP
ncbi:MAG: choice-of-anchor D domain-containing protein [Prosthecobacter sp.]